MSEAKYEDGVASGRLEKAEYRDNFSDLHPPLTAHEALVASDRCYFCHDAPCTTACPTEIDIPMFIRQIATGDIDGSARTIFDQNILGGMCARVCPTEQLCEEACVREKAEGKPVLIGQLQRYATDHVIAAGRTFYERAAETGKKIAVVGAGPAGLACAHRCAMHGHDVVIIDSRPKPGGLNEYGIAAYKTLDDFARKEIEYLLSIGGISIQTSQDAKIDLDKLREQYDAVFLGIGLAGVNELDVAGADSDGVEDAVEYIANLRQASDYASLPVGRRVVVIGGGMTAIDIAVQAKLIGAEEVTICYRRGRENMNASVFEQDLATSKGVLIRHNLQPSRVLAENGKTTAIELEYTSSSNGKLAGTGKKITLAADQVFRAVGQTLAGQPDGIKLAGGRIEIDAEGKTSLPDVWAGGDCAAGGDDLTVSAVAMGRDAAESIVRALSKSG